jgi:hypothetical protein
MRIGRRGDPFFHYSGECDRSIVAGEEIAVLEFDIPSRHLVQFPEGLEDRFFALQVA